MGIVLLLTLCYYMTVFIWWPTCNRYFFRLVFSFFNWINNVIHSGIVTSFASINLSRFLWEQYIEFLYSIHSWQISSDGFREHISVKYDAEKAARLVEWNQFEVFTSLPVLITPCVQNPWHTDLIVFFLLVLWIPSVVLPTSFSTNLHMVVQDMGGIRDPSGYRFSQWETALQCNLVSDWLSPYPEWSLKSAITQTQHNITHAKRGYISRSAFFINSRSGFSSFAL